MLGKEAGIRIPKKITELVSIMQEKHAKDILVLQLSRMAVFTNHFIICTGESLPQVKAIAEEVFNKLPGRCPGKEGFPANSWVLLDYGGFILHIFLPQAREFYGLERIWADAPAQEISDQ